jgi:hypothetical protein
MDTEHLRSFILNNAVIQIAADKINDENDVSRERVTKHLYADPLLSPYIPQFDIGMRANAASMSAYYEIFYMLENHIRSTITNVLEEAKGSNWWDDCVPENVRNSATHNLQRELDAGVSRRSTDLIDYITFGELGEIIKSNWDQFGSIFSSKKGLEKVLASLNLLRGTIAHCGMLSEDEVLRLKLTVRDWFRLMS